MWMRMDMVWTTDTNRATSLWMLIRDLSTSVTDVKNKPSRTKNHISTFLDDMPGADIFTIEFDLLPKWTKVLAITVRNACKCYKFSYIKDRHLDADLTFAVRPTR